MVVRGAAQARATIRQIWSWLAEIQDPELPVISVVDLGIVRDVAWAGEGDDVRLVVAVTPTYSGCPATQVIADAIREALSDRGIRNVELQWRLSPAWTTDWMSDAGRQKLQSYGIAPPEKSEHRIDVSRLRAHLEPRILCPRCGASQLTLASQFGSTPCKALYRCDACREPFDYFKAH